MTSETTTAEALPPNNFVEQLVHRCETRVASDAGSPTSLAASAVFVFTKDRADRLAQTVPGLARLGLPTLVLDDSTSPDVRTFLHRDAPHPSIRYHGKAEQARLIRALGVQLGPCVRELGNKHWQLPACRNYSILIARACGLERMLMIDDDILVEDHGLAKRSLRFLSADTLCVGAQTDGMPDDSVIGHIERSVGWPVTRFISGQYLALQVSRAVEPFPPVYNEDWLFMLLQSGQGLTCHSSVCQLSYDPFEDGPRRATFQEFGEVLVEGVVDALASGSLRSIEAEHLWQATLHRRRLELAELRGELPDADDRAAIVDAAIETLRRIDPAKPCRFFADLDAERYTWRALLEHADSLHLDLEEISTSLS